VAVTAAINSNLGRVIAVLVSATQVFDIAKLMLSPLLRYLVLASATINRLSIRVPDRLSGGSRV